MMLSFIRHGCRFLNSRLGCDAAPPSFFPRASPSSAESCFLTLLYVKSSDSALGWNDSQVEHRQLHTAFLRLAPLLSYLLRRMLLNWRS